MVTDWWMWKALGIALFGVWLWGRLESARHRVHIAGAVHAWSGSTGSVRLDVSRAFRGSRWLPALWLANVAVALARELIFRDFIDLAGTIVLGVGVPMLLSQPYRRTWLTQSRVVVRDVMGGYDSLDWSEVREWSIRDGRVLLRSAGQRMELADVPPRALEWIEQRLGHLPADDRAA